MRTLNRLLKDAHEEGLQIIVWGETTIRRNRETAIVIDNAGAIRIKATGRKISIGQSRSFLGLDSESVLS